MNSTSAHPPMVGAGLMRRLGAMAYDGLLLLGIWMTTLYLMVRINQGQAVQGAGVQSLLFLEAFGYFAWSWIRTGQTIGMMAWRLEVVNLQGPPRVTNDGPEPTYRRITLLQACIRTLGFFLGMLPAALGYLWILFDPYKRAVADRLSDSLVIHNPRATIG